MVGGGEEVKLKPSLLGMSTGTPGASSPGPSTPPPSSERETVARQLHGYLSGGFCDECSQVLRERIMQLASSGTFDGVRMPDSSGGRSPSSSFSAQCSLVRSPDTSSPSPVAADGRLSTPLAKSSATPGSGAVIKRGRAPDPARAEAVVGDDLVEERMSRERRLLWEQRERVRFSQVRRKKNFLLTEKVEEGRVLNVLEGLELHAGVFNAEEQMKIVDCIYALQKLGEGNNLTGRTYSRPKKWMRGKGRVTMQFGCCYNYAMDKDGNPPGIVQDEEVDSLPTLFKLMIKRMVRWHVLPPSCVPNSCIVNIYEEGDCIPPHIDHHDFLRPFCTVSFLSECNILFGSNLKVVAPGEFSGPMAIPLPVGSVLVLNGNGADVAKHCVPGVPMKRISITFRKMDDSHLPYKFSPEPDLQGIQPLQLSPTIFPELEASKWSQHHTLSELQLPKVHEKNKSTNLQSEAREQSLGSPFFLAHDDFPPLGKSNPPNKASKSRR